jgi:hypothetical protein
VGVTQERAGSGTSAGVHAALLDLIAARIPPERAPILAAFARAYVRRLSPDADAALEPAARLAELEGAFALADRWAVAAVREDLARARRELAERALRDAGASAPVEEAIAAFLADRAAPLRRLGASLRSLDDGTGRDRSTALSLAVRHLRAVAE